MARLLHSKIAFGHLNSVAEFAAHPQLTFRKVRVGDEEIEIIAPGIRHDAGISEDKPWAVPRLGQHDQALRREFRVV